MTPGLFVNNILRHSTARSSNSSGTFVFCGSWKSRDTICSASVLSNISSSPHPLWCASSMMWHTMAMLCWHTRVQFVNIANILCRIVAPPEILATRVDIRQRSILHILPLFTFCIQKLSSFGTTSAMEVLVAPISGGGIPSQVACCMHLCNIQYKPDFVFASSGGTVSAYVMEAANWYSRRVPSVLGNISGAMFLKSWNMPMMDKLYGMCKGSMYNSGDGGVDFMDQTLDTESVGCREIWVGACDINDRKLRIMCNLVKEESKLTIDPIHVYLHNVLPPTYASRDILTLGTFVMASCAIPGYVPEVCIRENAGIISASPVSYFKEALAKRAREVGGGIHFTVLTCDDMNEDPNNCYYYNNDKETATNMIESVIHIGIQMINMSIVRDRV